MANEDFEKGFSSENIATEFLSFAQGVFNNGSTKELKSAFGKDGAGTKAIANIKERASQYDSFIKQLNELKGQTTDPEQQEKVQQLIEQKQAEQQKLNEVVQKVEKFSKEVSTLSAGFFGNFKAGKVLDGFAKDLTGEVDDWDEPITKEELTFTERDFEDVQKAVEATNKRIEEGPHKEDVVQEVSTATEELVEKVKSGKEPITEEIEPQQETVAKQEKVTIEVSSPGASNKAPPPPPPLPPTPPKNSFAERVQKKEGIEVAQSTSLMDEIRNAKLKKSRVGELSTEEFQYVPTPLKEPNNPLHGALMMRRVGGIQDPEEVVEELFEGKNTKQQINCLYSAVIEGNEVIVDAIVEHGNPEVFTEELMEKICDAVMDVAASQKPDKKIILEKHAKSLADSAGIELQGKSEDRGRG